MKKILIPLIALFTLALTLIAPSPTSAQTSVPIRTYGGVSATEGTYYLQSDSTGQGSFKPGTTITVDSYFFQCKGRGTASCSTEWNSDAVLIGSIRKDQVTVPNLNQKSGTYRHSYTPPYGNCGRVQFDNGVVGVNGAVGGWVHDFGVDCESTPTPPPVNSCNEQLPINTQFRTAGTQTWLEGSALGELTAGQRIDVNCFAKNGTAALSNARIEITLPSGKTSTPVKASSLSNYYLSETGTYRFRCYMSTDNQCQNTDNIRVKAATASPTPTPSPSPSPSASPATHQSSCEDLDVISGNNQTVPAKVTLRARGKDNQGSVQRYKFFFGDGKQLETDQSQVTHTYEASGSFTARVEVKDSKGNWVSDNQCETTVKVKASQIESHKSACSDVYFTASNKGKAPSTVKFKISGYDNKGDLKGYKLDLGDGTIKEATGREFEHTYTKAGTYTIKAYVKDSKDAYKGGENDCHRQLYINTEPLVKQPKTGTPTTIALFGAMSGVTAVGLSIWKIKQLRLS